MKRHVSGLYPWPFDGNLQSGNTALLIVDMQNDYCASGGWIDQLGKSIEPLRRPIASLGRVLSAFRRAGYYVLFTRESYRADLSDLNSNRHWRSRLGQPGIGDKGANGRILVRGEPGCEIIPELAPEEDEPVVDRPATSAFYASDLEQILRRSAIRNVVLGGVTTDFSVQATMRDANDRGFECLVLKDGCGALEPNAHEATLRMLSILRGHYGSIADSGALLEVLGTGEENDISAA